MPDLVELNVGGTVFTTNRATLEESQPQSMQAALVSGRHGPPRRDAKVRGAEKARRALKGEGLVRVVKFTLLARSTSTSEWLLRCCVCRWVGVWVDGWVGGCHT